MSIVLLLFSTALFGLYFFIRFQICAARRRYLIDTYGLDSNKLRKMTCKEVAKFKALIQELKNKEDAFELEAIIRPLRPTA